MQTKIVKVSNYNVFLKSKAKWGIMQTIFLYIQKRTDMSNIK